MPEFCIGFTASWRYVVEANSWERAVERAEELFANDTVGIDLDEVTAEPRWKP
ncbi:MAG: hypothetical protein ACRDQA_05800 [Nocardioidaceae bacterium]